MATATSGSESTLDQMTKIPLSIVNFGLSVMYVGASIALTPITIPLYVGKKIYNSYTAPAEPVTVAESNDDDKVSRLEGGKLDEVDETNTADPTDDSLS